MRQWSRARLWLMASLATLVPASGFAIDLTPDNSPYLGDPTFFAPPGHLYGVTTFGYQDATQDFVLPSGKDEPHSVQRQDTVFQQLAYGVTDRLLVAASITYGKAWETEAFGAGAPEDFRAVGVFNPTFGADWRIIAQAPDGTPFNLDLGANYSPSLFAYRFPSSGRTGTMASGEQTSNVAVEVSRKLRSLTLEAYVTAGYDDERKQFQTADGSTETYGTNFVYGGGVSGQLRLAERLYVDLGVEVIQQTDTPVFDAVEHVANTRSSDPNLESSFVLGWQLVPNRVGLEAEYDRDYFGDIAVNSATSQLGTWKNQVENAYYLRLRYVLF